MDAPAAVSSAALPTLRLSSFLLQHHRPPPGGSKGVCSPTALDSQEAPHIQQFTPASLLDYPGQNFALFSTRG